MRALPFCFTWLATAVRLIVFLFGLAMPLQLACLFAYWRRFCFRCVFTPSQEAPWPLRLRRSSLVPSLLRFRRFHRPRAVLRLISCFYAILIMLTKEELIYNYRDLGLSTRALAKKFHTHQRAIIQTMCKLGISRRNRIDAVIAGTKKISRVPFSGNQEEKAYLLGLTFADFRRRCHGFQINISAGTTHPAFVALFKSLFGKYSPISERPYYSSTSNSYGWVVDTYLDASFDFLLAKKQVPNWISTDSGLFLSFLAGYFDGEGTVSICKNSSKCVSFILAISSQDKGILFSVYRGLRQFGLHPSFRRIRPRGTYSLFRGRLVPCNRDVWFVRLKRKQEVLSLLGLLPLRHSEKIRKRALMFSLKGCCYLSDVMPPWKKLKGEIKSEVDEFIAKAVEIRYSRKLAD